MKLFKKVTFLISALLFIAALIMILTGNMAKAGIVVLLFFLSVAVIFQTSKALKGYTYTIMIFASVSMALYYPQYFVRWGSFELSGLITPLIQLIMFGMGTSMSFKDFVGVVKTPKGVFIGVASQFMIMSLMGFTLANLSGFPPEISAGIILIGCSPSGMASNVISYLAKANLALSITITATTTLLAPFVTPILMKVLAGTFIEINVLDMMWGICKMVIIPIAFGLAFNKLFGGKIKWLDKAMPLISMFGIAFSIVVIVAAGRDSLLTMGLVLLVIVLVHNLSGYFLGYWFARLFKMSRRDCRTIAIEVGMQNGGLASGIAQQMGKIATVGLAPAVFGSMMNVTGSLLATWWHKRPPKENKPEEKKLKLQTS